MPQKKRLELKPDHNLKTQKFYSTKKFVFVLDLQIFYESGSVLKIVLPSGRLKYIHLQSTFESFKLGRSIGLGFIEGNNFHWIDFYPNPTFSFCIEWVTAFLRYLRVSLFSFCILFFTEMKKYKEPKLIFGSFIYYLIYFLDLSGWGLHFHEPYYKLFSENRHFLFVCITTVNDLPLLNRGEFEKAYREIKKTLTVNEKHRLIKLQKVNDNEIPLSTKIKMLYWIFQQASLNNITKEFSITSWSICADLLLYYAQSLRLWIP